MKKNVFPVSALSLAVFMASGSAFASFATVGLDAKSAGVANTGIASGDFTRAPLNPALLTQYKENDDVYLRLGAGVVLSEYRDALDRVDDTQDAIDAFEKEPLNRDKADALLAELGELDSTNLMGEASLDLGVFLPGKKLPLAVTAGSYLVGNGSFNYAESDKQLIEDVYNGVVPFDPDNLESSGTAHAVALSEISLSFAHEFDFPSTGVWSLGMSGKYQQIDSYLYRATISDYDSGDYKDHAEEGSAFNMDIGLYKPHGDWSFGLVGKNLIKQTLENVEHQDVLLEPTFTAAASWQKNMFTGTVELDLNENGSFVMKKDEPQLLEPRQFARFGAELDIIHVQLRAGYQTDLSNNYEDLMTVGIGISPWDLFSLDLAGQIGEDEVKGVLLQFGLKI